MPSQSLPTGTGTMKYHLLSLTLLMACTSAFTTPNIHNLRLGAESLDLATPVANQDASRTIARRSGASPSPTCCPAFDSQGHPLSGTQPGANGEECKYAVDPTNTSILKICIYLSINGALDQNGSTNPACPNTGSYCGPTRRSNDLIELSQVKQRIDVDKLPEDLQDKRTVWSRGRKRGDSPDIHKTVWIKADDLEDSVIDEVPVGEAVVDLVIQS